ncbi:hypothetical protein KMP13_11550 [Epibacterium ulvae]|uniref:hypothetical protein n=1 Tax=Epibacterium ulvae TaxID=1156985 RepID=UPI001BFC968C|nr:hypothetical protein [Epibacterium ulvae]MBT8154521.1 hypothetical protein [Epibacterium ulvae]
MRRKMLLSERKTFRRIAQFEAESGLNFAQDMRLNGQILPAPRRIAEEMIEIIRNVPKRPASVLHGDFCFSNILYNSRTRRVRVIDPRGHIDSFGTTIGGDCRYDMAKLSHSVVGWYDLIIAGRFECRVSHGQTLGFDFAFENAQRYTWMVERLERLSVTGIAFDAPEIRALTILLFLSMLPLHGDQPTRQMAFLANALRLYQQFS